MATEASFVNPILSELRDIKTRCGELERLIEGHIPMPRKEPRRYAVNDIVVWVAYFWQFSVDDIKSHHRRYCVARQVTMYLAHKYAEVPLQTIGRVLGHFHHSTVLHAVDCVESRMASDPAFAARVNAIIEKLK